MLTCRELDDFLVDFLDGRLPLRQRLSMQMHLAMCRDCRRFLEEYRQAIRLGREAVVEEHGLEQVPEGLIRAVLANLPDRPGNGGS